MYQRIAADIKAGIVKPLKTTVFPANEVEQAFRYMAGGKHIGKVLLKIRENPGNLQSTPIAVNNRIFCKPNETYVLIGGLGGFGMELADFLVLRGCRKLVMSSSRGISNAYQTYKIKLWRSYGVEVVVSTADITTFAGCEKLICEASALGSVGGIFNLAVALRDGIFENQTEAMFRDSMAVKASATEHLDKITRTSCSSFTFFVVFSSVSCGRGNAGQSSYGMSNSIMERIVEKRVRDGFHGKAIQWGAISDVGLLSELQDKNLNVSIGGTLPQNLNSCLQVLDDLITSSDPVVASMVVAEKIIDDGKKGNIIDVVLNIMSIRNKKTLSMDSTLVSLGMDSLMGVEIQQVLERDFDYPVSAQELRLLTLSQLGKKADCKTTYEKREMPDEIKMILTSFGDEATSDQLILKLESRQLKKDKKLLIIPGFEGMSSDIWKKFAQNLDYSAFILQFGKVTSENIDDILSAVSKVSGR